MRRRRADLDRRVGHKPQEPVGPVPAPVPSRAEPASPTVPLIPLTPSPSSPWITTPSGASPTTTGTQGITFTQTTTTTNMNTAATPWTLGTVFSSPISSSASIL